MDERARRLNRLKQWKKTQPDPKSPTSIEPKSFSLTPVSRKPKQRRAFDEADSQRSLKKIHVDPSPLEAVDLGATDSVDPLDQFMQNLNGSNPSSSVLDRDDDDELTIDDVDTVVPRSMKKPKSKDIPDVDHSLRQYPDFQRVFYTGESLTDDVPGIKVSRPLAPIYKWELGGFSQRIIDQIKLKNYAKPTPIQSVAAAAIMGGHDVMAIAQTGSGKTMAFVLPMLRHVQAQSFQPGNDGPIAIVLAPTRELCAQIYAETAPLACAVGLESCCAYGGSDIKSQIDKLVKKNVHIVIATPGRLIDLLAANKGRVLSTLKTSFVVVDEADRMFDMGFSPQLYRILATVRPDNQTVLCSATFSASMRQLATQTLHDHVHIEVGESSRVSDSILQILEFLDEEKKFNRLMELLEPYRPPDQSIVFVERQELADDLASQLLIKGYKCTSLHGGKSQEDRDNSIAEFREGNLDLLVATSIAARGIDVRMVRLVVNFDPPNHLEDYIHRVGRTGRAGESGKAVTFFSPGQYKQAFEVSRAFEDAQIPKPIKQIASQYKEHHNSDRAGFGGNGLDKLDVSRERARAANFSLFSDESMVTPKASIIKTASGFSTELLINDYPAQARRSVTSLKTQTRISDQFQVSLTMRGQYNKYGDKLRIVVEGASRELILNAYDDLMNVVIASTEMAQLMSTRYTV